MEIPNDFSLTVHIQIKIERPLSEDMAVSYEEHTKINFEHLYSFFRFIQMFIKHLIYVRHCSMYLLGIN